jgi:phospholipid/cholesterol/gamma-HCH transport system permease protein
LRGEWTAAQLAEPGVWQALQVELTQAVAAGAAQGGSGWDLRDVQRLDHTGAQVLWNAWGHQWPALASSQPQAAVQAHPGQHALLARVARYTAPAPKPAHTTLLAYYLAFGRRVLRLLDHMHGLLLLLGQLLLDALRLLRHPSRGPWRDFSGHLVQIGAKALPITALVGFLIGVVLAYLMTRQLKLLGADLFIVDILGISLIRELGPVLAAVLIAGRSGSTITAQIGVMRVTEEIDAMRVLGIAQGFRLVLPRVLAMAVAMPLISVWTTLAALTGGMLVADLLLQIPPSYFVLSLPEAVHASNLTLATAKSAVFGVLIALIGCHYGLRVQPNTESLGQGTTASVVTSITVVILVDALFAVLFKDVGL